MTPAGDEPIAQAQAIMERVLALVRECRMVVRALEHPPNAGESSSTEAERILYSTLVSALENGLVRAMEDLVSVCSLRDRGPVPVYLPKAVAGDHPKPPSQTRT